MRNKEKLRTDKNIHDGKTNKNPKEEKLISNGNQQSHHSKAQDNDAERDGKEKDQPETTVHDTTTDDKTTDNKKKVRLLLQINKEDYFYSEEAQKHRVNKYVDDEKDYRYNSLKIHHKEMKANNIRMRQQRLNISLKHIGLKY